MTIRTMITISTIIAIITTITSSTIACDLTGQVSYQTRVGLLKKTLAKLWQAADDDWT